MVDGSCSKYRWHDVDDNVIWWLETGINPVSYDDIDYDVIFTFIF